MRRRSRLLGLLLLAALAIVPARAAEPPPEILRLRVPSDRVKGLFPPGTELRVLPRDDFESLVKSATRGRSAEPADGPRLVRARHEAKLVDGLLHGRSELMLSPGAGPGSAVPLEPWTPAILAPSPPIRVGADRRMLLAAPDASSAEGTTTLEWEQRPEPGTDGRSFRLGLPAVAACRLVLDLPEGFVPEVAGAIRMGPSAGSAPDRRTWRLDAPGGPWRLHLRTPRREDEPDVPVAIRGVTRIDASQSPARWTLDAVIDPGPKGPRRVRLRLDPALELVDLSGPGITSYRSEPIEGGGTTVSIRLADAVEGPTPLTIRAFTRAEDGEWTVPSYEPEGAIWTGGRTLLRLRSGQVVSASRPLGGRQVTPRASEREFGASRAGLILAFESSAPGPPVALTLRHPGADASAEVRGLVTVAAREPASLEARIVWQVDRGRLPTLSADLPPGWTASRVAIRGLADPPSWHAEARPGGGSRLVVRPPPMPESGGPIELEIAAVAERGARVEALDLPRVTPLGARVADEVWALRAEGGWIVAPRSARGLGWLDPATFEVAGTVSSTSRPVLAWRWTAGDGRATVSVSPEAPVRHCRAWTVATVGGGRIATDFYWDVPVKERTAADVVAILAGAANDLEPRWDLPAEPGRAVEADRLADAEAGRLGIPRGSPAWRVRLPRDGRERVLLHARADRPWDGTGRVPLARLPRSEGARGTLLVRSDRGDRVDLEAKGLTRLDPGWATSAFLQGAGAELSSGPRGRPTRALAYDADAPPPRMTTQPLPAAGPAGVVEEARLTTLGTRQGRPLHRLGLRVAPGPDRVLDVTMPRGSTLGRAEIEGRSAAPVSVEGTLRFALPAPSSMKATVEVAIDYLGPVEPSASAVRPIGPDLSLPCLAFLWEVEPPAGWSIVGTDGGLTPTEGPTARATPNEAEIDRAALRAFDERAKLFPPADGTLGAWLVRLDGGRVPVVVDRPALDAAGWGPKTALPSNPSADRPTDARSLFAALGLSLTIRSGCAVVGLEGRPVEARSVAQAANLGHDATDRYQSVSRWRGEPTPGSGLAPDRAAGRAIEPPGRGFAAPGWPGSGARVTLSDPSVRLSRAASIACVMAALAWSVRRVGAGLRALGLGLLLAAGLYFGRGPGVAEGIAAGGCASAGLWLGAAMRRPRAARAEVPSPISASSFARSAGAGAAVVLMLWSGISTSPAQQVTASAPAASGPILALLPYDPPFDPDRASDRVILRLEDDERLRALARAIPARSGASPWLTGALHEVRREGPRDARVASAFDLLSDAAGPTRWSFPAEAARDLSATLDGRDVPVVIEPGGVSAGVEVPPGTHRLIVRRLVALSRSVQGDALRLAVPPIASARLRVQAPPDGPLVASRSARGRVEVREGILEANVGPLATLSVQWSGRGDVGPPAPRGAAEATILWDVEPAGDRVRARITARSAEGLDRLVLDLGAGVTIRSADRPVLADAAIRATTRGTTWELPLDPPLAAGQTLTIDAWRPRQGSEPIRRMPRIEPLGLAEFSGLIGARRPADWAGRIDADLPDAVPDDVFARAWGALPDDTATLAGASRFAGTPDLALATGPDRDRPRVRPRVALELAPGRLDVRSEAEVVDEFAPARELEVRIPADLRLVRVEAPGLTDWVRVGGDRLRLRFDAEPYPPSRTLRIIGFVPIDDDPMAAGPGRSEGPAPWPLYPGSVTVAGTLTVAAPPGFSNRLLPASGVTASADPVEGPEARAAGSARTTFAVPAGAVPGQLQWTAEAPGVSVRVQSLLVLHPDSVEWTSTARYATAWGPCPPIRLRMPSDWARAARVEIGGEAVTPEVETLGRQTYWTLRPPTGTWGRTRLVVTATRPRLEGSPLAYPDLVPLGRPGSDRVDSYLGYADLSGRPAAVEGSAELQPVDGSRWDEKDLAWPPVAPRNVLRVVAEGWALRFLPAPRPRSPEQGAGVTLADLECTLAPDGSILGRASYDLDGAPADFLAVALPPGAEPLAAAVDGVTVVPRREERDRLRLPLVGAVPARVAFVWRSPPTGDGADGRRRLSLPTLPGQSRPMLLTVAAPDGVEIVSSGALTSIVPAELELARAVRRARALSERGSNLDRGSTRERSALLGALVRFEIQARAAERAVRGAEAAGGPSPAVLLAPLREARAALAEALTASGLEDFLRSAAARVGRESTDPMPEAVEAPEPPAPLRLRPIGRIETYRGDTGADGLTWAARPDSPQAPTERQAPPILVAILGMMAAWAARRWPRLCWLILATTAILCGAGWPVGGVVTLAASGLGRLGG